MVPPAVGGPQPVTVPNGSSSSVTRSIVTVPADSVNVTLLIFPGAAVNVSMPPVEAHVRGVRRGGQPQEKERERDRQPSDHRVRGYRTLA